MSNASDRRQATRGLGIAGETDSYKPFTGKGNASKWQRTSKKNQYSEKLTGGGISAAKLNFLEEFKKFQDIKGLVGDLKGMVEGGIGSIGSQFASVFQDSVGNIFQNAGDTVKIPPMKKGGIVTSSSGNVLTSGGKPVTWGAGPPSKTYSDRPNMADIAGPLAATGSALPDARDAYRIGQYLEPSNTTSNTSGSSVQGVNPLLDFETMNYVLTLSCITTSAFNTGAYKDNPGVVIAKTGGKGKQGTGPLSYDYYINRLTTQNTVGPTTNARTTSAYRVQFDISEPLGVDLIPALITASQTQGYSSHLSAVYLLTIQFVGNDDNQEPQKIPSGTRYIPIRLFKVELSVDAGGGTYTCQGAPYNYLSFNDIYDRLNEPIVHNGNDVKTLLIDFFAQLNESKNQLKGEDVIVQPNVYELDTESSMSGILSSSLGFDLPGASPNQAINVSPVGGGGGSHSTARKVVASKGTSITSYLSHVAENSKMFLDRFNQSSEPESDALPTVKIMMTTEIIKTDNGTGEPQYKFKYAVRQQEILADSLVKDEENLSQNVEPVRTYNYIYTGENKDVLDFALDYKFAYYQQARYHTSSKTQKSENDDETIGDEQAATNREAARTSQYGSQPVNPDATDVINPDAPNSENRDMVSVFKDLLEHPGADLIAVKLTIIGDPYWMEQKSTRPGNKLGTSNGMTEPDGSVSPDANNIVVQVNAKYPSDLDDDTGLMKLDQSAFFQGKYRVITCENNFEEGIFTNTLSMVRFKHQSNDVQTSSVASSGGTLGGLTGKRRMSSIVAQNSGSTANVVKYNTGNHPASRGKGGGGSRRDVKRAGGGKFR